MKRKNKNKRICLCISNKYGLQILKLLRKKFSKIDVISIKKIENSKKIVICNNKKKFYKFLKNKQYDFLILVYWPYIIKKQYFNHFKNSINFHPSYLPYGRGWYPHIHSINNNNFPLGVTLHKIDEGVDTGPIWVQKKISKKNFFTSSEIYKKCQNELLILFKKNFLKIIHEKIKPKNIKRKIKYLKISEIKKYNELNLKQTFKVEKLLKLILSRQYKEKSYIYMRHKRKKIKIFIKLGSAI